MSDATVMVVDDESAVRRSMRAMLSDAFNVITFENGQEAVRFAAEHPNEIFAAFVDYAMPGCDGNEVCKALHKIDATISLIGFSGNDSAVFEEPLFERLSKKTLSVPEILSVASRAVSETAEKRAK